MRADRRVPELPRPAGRVVVRDRLLHRLDRLAPLTVVEGLHGLGRTTVVAEWVRHRSARGDAAAWVNAEAERARGRELLDVVTNHLLRTAASDGHAGLPAGAADADLALGRLGDRTTLVALDDADAVTLEEARRLLDLVVRWPNLHLVAVAHRATAFRAAAAEHRVEVHALGGGDLRVTAEELVVYADAWGHDLPPAQARRLHSLVGGWLHPLRLILDATPVGARDFALDAVDSYFHTHVRAQVEGTAGLDVAMRMAVPEELTPSRADMLLRVAPSLADERHTGDSVLTTLERAGLLIRFPRPEQGSVWRFPMLVRRQLIEHLQAVQSDLASACHRALAQEAAHTDSRDTAALLQHARAGADWSLLAELWSVERWWLAIAQPLGFRAAYRDVPDHAVEAVPTLRLPRAVARALDGEPPSESWVRRSYLQTGSSQLRALERVSDPGERFDILLTAALHRRAEGRRDDANRLLDLAARLCTASPDLAGEEGQDRAETVRAGWVHLERGVTEFLGADVVRAQQSLMRAYELRPKGPFGAAAAAHLALLHAITGSGRETGRWLSAAEPLVTATAWLRDLLAVPTELASACLAADRLDTDAADRALARVLDHAEATELWLPLLLVDARQAVDFGKPIQALNRLHTIAGAHGEVLRHDPVARSIVDRCRADLLLALGQANRVHRLVRDGIDQPTWLAVPAARLRLLTGDLEAAVRISAANVWSDATVLRDRIDLFLIAAAAHLASGRTEEAVTAFRHGHALASAAGNVAAYLGLQPEVRGTLAELCGVSLAALHPALAEAPSPWPASLRLVSLSPRESAVLEHLRRHDTTAQIARRLSVSVNTVKKQMVSLYAKLGVHDRREALLRAEQLGLLDDASPPADPAEPTDGF